MLVLSSYRTPSAIFGHGGGGVTAGVGAACCLVEPRPLFLVVVVVVVTLQPAPFDRCVSAAAGFVAVAPPREARGRLRAAGPGTAGNEGARRRQVDIYDTAQR